MVFFCLSLCFCSSNMVSTASKKGSLWNCACPKDSLPLEEFFFFCDSFLSGSHFSLLTLSLEEFFTNHFRPPPTVVIQQALLAATPSSESRFADLHYTVDDVLFRSRTCPHVCFSSSQTAMLRRALLARVGLTLAVFSMPVALCIACTPFVIWTSVVSFLVVADSVHVSYGVYWSY